MVCYVYCVACKGREVCGSSWSHMFTVTQRLDGEPGGLEDRAKIPQVRSDFSTPSRSTAPLIRPTGLCSKRGLVQSNWGEKAESRLRKGFGKCEWSGQGPGGYWWQVSPLPAASLSTLMMWASDGQSLCPLGLCVLHARQGSKNGSSTPIKPHMVLIERF